MNVKLVNYLWIYFLVILCNSSVIGNYNSVVVSGSFSQSSNTCLHCPSDQIC
jgi:ABC-type sulfate transport system permease subunit